MAAVIVAAGAQVVRSAGECHTAATAAGKHVGVGGPASRNDLMTQFVRMGARYVSTGTDMAFLISACAQKAKFVRDIGT